MSIQVGRVGLRGAVVPVVLVADCGCPFKWAASASAADQSERLLGVRMLCPFKWAASASAADRRSHPGRRSSSVHSSGPRRPPRHKHTVYGHHNDRSVHSSGPRRPPRQKTADYDTQPGPVSIQVGRVGLRGQDGKVRSSSDKSCVHSSGPRRPPRRVRNLGLFVLQGCVHSSGPRRPPRQVAGEPSKSMPSVSIQVGRVGLRGFNIFFICSNIH